MRGRFRDRSSYVVCGDGWRAGSAAKQGTADQDAAEEDGDKRQPDPARGMRSNAPELLVQQSFVAAIHRYPQDRPILLKRPQRKGPANRNDAKTAINSKCFCLKVVTANCKIREAEAGAMLFSGEEIAIILLAGLAIGLLPSALMERKGLRPISDVALAISVVLAGYWLALSWRAFVPAISEKETAIVKVPNYEPVVFPLAPLRPLLKPIIPRSREEICGSVTAETRRNDIPAAFFIRLLYQESGFRPEAISSSGALGIAQFMPETAVDRRLENPFDPLQAIPASARLLRDLYRKFGNLGLAAAAYNAGPKRVQDWIANKSPLPQETQDYVKSITGRPVEAWTVAETGSPARKLPQAAPCQETVGLLAWNGPDQIPMPPEKPRTTTVTAKTAVQQPARPPARSLRADPGAREIAAGP